MTVERSAKVIGLKVILPVADYVDIEDSLGVIRATVWADPKLKEMPRLIALAHMMAAAPDMLDALVLAESTLETAIRAGLDGFTDEEADEITTEHLVLSKVRAAIAKARGDRG